MSTTLDILILVGKFILSLMLLLLTTLLILITSPLVWLADQLLQLTHSLIKSTCHAWPVINKDSKLPQPIVRMVEGSQVLLQAVVTNTMRIIWDRKGTNIGEDASCYMK